MATDPKKDEHKGSEITDEKLENVSGGRIGRNLSASDVSDAELEGVAGGAKTTSPTESVYPTEPIDQRAGEKTAEEAR